MFIYVSAGRQFRDGSFFREGSVSLGSAFGGKGRLFSREGSAYREGSAQPDTPSARRGGIGERSRLGQATEQVRASPQPLQTALRLSAVTSQHA